MVSLFLHLLYTARAPWGELYVLSTGERLLRIALITALGYAGGECLKRAMRG